MDVSQMHEQCVIVDRIESVREKESALSLQLLKTITLKHGLMQNLFSSTTEMPA